MPKKIRELKSLLMKAGFNYRAAKGSHTRWVHPLLPSEPITIAGNDGDDAKPYIEKQVQKTLENLKNIQKESEQ
jgi:predicted RNA binding protein YcfA (HicA-like mRNA interferase family)